MSLNIAAAIQSQMLQTLLQALQSSEQPLKVGDTVEANFMGWAESAEPEAGARAQSAIVQRGTQPALSEAIIQIGGKTTSMLIEATPERRAQLQPGAILTLQVDNAGSAGTPAQMRLMTIQSQGDMVHSRTASSGVGTSTPGNTALPTANVTASDAVRAAAGPLVGAALARQNGLAPLFADLDALVRAPTTPPTPVVMAALRVLAMQTDSATIADQPDSLKSAVRLSGLFHEAMIANGAPGEAGKDLKSSLLALRQALREALGLSEAIGQTPADKQARADAKSAQLAPDLAAATRPQAPNRDGLPVPQGIAEPSIDVRTDRADAMMAKALDRTESALDRLTISQFASLPAGSDANQGAPLNRWFTELPLALDGRTAVLPLEIEEDGNAGATSGPQAKLWRVRFALDVEPMGPVHAMVTMQGRTIGVTVWAERDATSKLVRDHAADLKAALLDSDFDNPQIEVLAGQPMKRAAHAGHYLDRRS